MEALSSVVVVGLIVVGVVDALKDLSPRVTGFVTVVVAALVGSKIQLIPVVTRTTYRAGTTTVAGTIRATNNNYIYLVRGYDPKFQNRVLINSKSAGGNGVSLALLYTSGANIGNWKQI